MKYLNSHMNAAYTFIYIYTHVHVCSCDQTVQLYSTSSRSLLFSFSSSVRVSFSWLRPCTEKGITHKLIKYMYIIMFRRLYKPLTLRVEAALSNCPRSDTTCLSNSSIWLVFSFSWKKQHTYSVTLTTGYSMHDIVWIMETQQQLIIMGNETSIYNVT